MYNVLPDCLVYTHTHIHVYVSTYMPTCTHTFMCIYYYLRGSREDVLIFMLVESFIALEEHFPDWAYIPYGLTFCCYFKLLSETLNHLGSNIDIVDNISLFCELLSICNDLCGHFHFCLLLNKKVWLMWHMTSS